MAFEKRNPDYKLKARPRNGGPDTIIGRGWVNKDSSLSIQLNPCVVLSWKDDVYIVAFPNDPETAVIQEVKKDG